MGTRSMDREQLKDTLGRAMKDLRISVTDRCNFRCSYCMPLEKYEWIDRSEILTLEEVARLAKLFIRLGYHPDHRPLLGAAAIHQKNQGVLQRPGPFPRWS